MNSKTRHHSFIIKIGWVLELVFIFLIILFLFPVNNIKNTNSKKLISYQSISWDRDDNARLKYKDKAIKYNSVKELLNKNKYFMSDFKEIYDKDFYKKPINPSKDFDFLENLENMNHDVTYQITNLSQYAATFANFLLANDENILAWKVSDSKNHKEKAIVYLEGGPTADLDESNFWIPQTIYGKYGETFYFNQAQFGLKPIQQVYNNKQKYLELNFPTHIKNKIINKELNDKDAMRILVGDTNFKLNIMELMLSTSMAIAKVDGDKIAFLGNKLKQRGYSKKYYGGWSYGYTMGVNAILNNTKNLDVYNAIALENNLLIKKYDDGKKIGGIDESVCHNCLDDFFVWSVKLVKGIYGQIKPLEDIFNNPKLKTKIQNKVYFKSIFNDQVIGKPSEEELIFYCENNLNFTFLKHNWGHNHEFTDDEYKLIFS